MNNLLSVIENLNLIAKPTAESIKQWKGNTPLNQITVANIDPDFADTVNFCKKYDWTPERSGNCVVLEAKKGDRKWFVSVVVNAGSRADINGTIRKYLEAR